MRVVRDPSQAEEVAQEAFLEIWRTASRFDPDTRQRRLVDPDAGPPQGGRPGSLGRGSTRRDTTYHQGNQGVEHDSTAEAAQASMEARRVRQAMDSLTEVQREALELAYLQGLHAHGGRHHARPPSGHGQDTNPGRTDPSPRHDGGGTVTELTARTVRCLRRRCTRRRRAQQPSSGTSHSAPTASDEVASLREATALMADDAATDPSPGPARLRAGGHQERSARSRPRPPSAPPTDSAPRPLRTMTPIAPVLPMRPRRRRDRRPGRGRGSHPGRRRRRGAPALAGRPRPSPR